MAAKSLHDVHEKLFSDLKKEISVLDPVAFAENYLTIDSRPFKMTGNGWKFMADLYREVAVQATSPNAKPMVILKGRQVGATILAAVLSLYFTSSGLYGNGPNSPPMRILHAFPTLGIMSKYTKDKLKPMIQGSVDKYIEKRALRHDAIHGKMANEDTLTEYSFIGFNKLRVDSVGKDADRIRGLTEDGIMYDECFIFSQCIEIENGKMEIGKIYDLWKAGLPLPRAKSFNENTGIFEYKQITNAWRRGRRELVNINCDGRDILCTANHPFLTTKGWIRAGQLECGHQLKSATAEGTLSALPVNHMSLAHRSDIVYDIEVKDNHNFILTSDSNDEKLGGPIVSNCQDMTKEAIENSLRILTAAQYGPPTKGIQLFFGTPKNTGSYFFRLWEESDQRYYQLRCVECDHYFFLFTIGSEEWREILVSGYDIKCPSCDHIQHKTEAIEGGRWKATKESAKYVGYHLNILLNPRYTREMILEFDPSFNRSRTEKSWRNETLGEFYSGGSTPLTMDEVYAHCLDSTRALTQSCKSTPDKTLVMGIDWGGKDYNEGSMEDEDTNTGGQSYTAACILSVNKNGVFTVENAFRLKKNDFAYKIEVIQELFRRYNIKLAVADLYYGQDVVNHMQVGLNYGSRFLSCINSGSLGTMLTYKPKDLRVTLNKDMMIEEIFSLIRKDKIKFPSLGTSYDQIHWLMEHCTSMEVKTIKRNDNFIKKYEKGAIPNDGLMALMYGVVAYKYIATNGFKSIETTKRASNRSGPILAYAPGFK